MTVCKGMERGHAKNLVLRKRNGAADVRSVKEELRLVTLLESRVPSPLLLPQDIDLALKPSVGLSSASSGDNLRGKEGAIESRNNNNESGSSSGSWPTAPASACLVVSGGAKFSCNFFLKQICMKLRRPAEKRSFTSWV